MTENTPQKKKSPVLLIVLGIVGLILLGCCGLAGIGALVGGDNPSSSPTTASASSSPVESSTRIVDSQAESTSPQARTEAAAPTVSKPEAQVAFERAVNEFRDRYPDAGNEVQKSMLVDERASKFREAGIQSAAGWVGRVDSIQTNTEGKGILVISLPDCRAKLATWNNALSDALDNTLIDKQSPVYRSMASLNRGDMVRFNAQFFSDQTTYLKVVNLTESGKMTSPEFLVRFNMVEPID